MKPLKSLLITALAGMALATSASAQNSATGPGDLFLTIQNPGGATNPGNIYVATLGLTSTVFRDAAPGSFTLLGVNLASTLSNYGAGWADLSTIYLGAADYRGNSPTSTTLLTGDPHRTLYLTKARTSLGTVGEANSALNAIGIGSANTAVSNITTVKDDFEQDLGAGSFPIGSFTTTTSFVDDQNPVSAGLQGLGWGVVNGGAQANFAAGSFGSLGDAGAVELALDLYRVQYRNDIAGQYGFGAPTQTGEYLGTITVNSAGDVGYLKAVPEPGSTAFIGLGVAGMLLAGRRHRRASANV
jgi:hypothetical protein